MSDPRRIRGIALVGEPGSGKTSISEELMTLLGWDRLSFAAPLKSEVAAGLATPERNFLDYIGEMNNPAVKDHYRPVLQAWGSFRRAENPYHWVNRLRDEMFPNERYVIDDCRYWNEYEFLRDAGFVFVRLLSGATTRPLSSEQASHESERDWPSFPADLTLTYEPGPRHQAERVAEFFGLMHRFTAYVSFASLPHDQEYGDGGDIIEDSPAFIEDALPEDDDGFSVKECDGFICAHHAVTFDPPYTGRVQCFVEDAVPSDCDCTACAEGPLEDYAKQALDLFAADDQNCGDCEECGFDGPEDVEIRGALEDVEVSIRLRGPAGATANLGDVRITVPQPAQDTRVDFRIPDEDYAEALDRLVLDLDALDE